MNTPKVSVIMPSLNVAPYIRECMESVVNQTLTDIEIICVDAGSTDGTREVLEEYAAKDPRIKLIHSDKKSYGYQMNLGLENATGEYIGIVETDDWAELNMYHELWSAAEAKNVDVVKSNYYWHYTKPTVEDKPFENLVGCVYSSVISPRENLQVFSSAPAIWSGIYRRSMLEEYQIRFNETPGAAYQDASFHFMVCTVADTLYLLNKYYLHYRKDNENSSVNSDEKVYCVSDEMHYYESFLNRYPDYKRALIKPYMALKYEKYSWNYSRLAAQFQWNFLYLTYKEFSEHEKRGYLEPSFFTNKAWADVKSILVSPVSFFRNTCKKLCTCPSGEALPAMEIIKENTVEAPEASIIIPAYNVEKYIEKSLSSAQKQSFQNIEIICVDDGSSDDTLRIILACASTDSRITVAHQVNMGQSTARNHGLALSKGKYVFFLDSDDMLREDAVASLTKTADEKQLDILYFDGQSVFESPELQSAFPYYVSAYQYKCDMTAPAPGIDYFCAAIEKKKYRASVCMGCYRRSFLIESNLLFLDGILQEDNAFSFSCNMLARRVYHTEDQFYLRLVRANSTMISSKTFEHVYGYLTCILYFDEKASALPYSDRLFSDISTERRGLISQMKNAYTLLSDKSSFIRKLNPIELAKFNELVQNGGNNTSEEILLHRSYEIGKAITWLPRKIREKYRRIKTKMNLLKTR